jgi:hypothetical protein
MISWLRAHPWWTAAGSGVVAFCAGVGTGYYTLPAEEVWRSVVSIQTKEVEVIKEVEKRVEVKGPVRTVTKIVERIVPGSCGAPPTILHDTETVEEEGPVVTTVDTAKDERHDLENLGVTATEHTVKREAPRLTLLFTFGTSVTTPAPVYGGAIMYRVLGPLTLGAAFDSSLRATLAGGVTF